MSSALPSWFEHSPGTSNVLVIAPHGGVTEGDLLLPTAAGRHGNDLHTADLAGELAERLSAGRLVNPTCDRNVLDLNRVQEVRERAPWFLALLEQYVDAILVAHTNAVLLFVHGWHVGQARCDLGIGARLQNAGEAGDRADRLTSGPRFVNEELEAFRQGLEDAGVLATYGERWPAAHRNNLMRLFRRRPAKEEFAATLRKWVAQGRIEAVQLELGIPLRWPGPQRRALVDHAVRVFGPSRGHSPAKSISPTTGTAAARAADAPSMLAVQAFDPDAGSHGVGVIVGARRLSETEVGARLQLFPGGERMGIFIGHGQAGPSLGVPDLSFEEAASGFDVRFAGQVLVSDDAPHYFRSEPAQARARLCEASVELAFRERSPGFGDLRGRVQLDGEEYDVRTMGFVNAPMAVARGARHGSRFLLSFGSAEAARLDVGDSSDRCVLHRLGPEGWEHESTEGGFGASAAGWTVELDNQAPLHLERCTTTSLLRPVGPRQYIHTTVAFVRARWGERQLGGGFGEQRRPLME